MRLVSLMVQPRALAIAPVGDINHLMDHNALNI